MLNTSIKNNTPRQIPIENINEEIVFFEIYGLNQNWNTKNTFNYINTSRPNHGFMYVSCDEVIITFPNGDVKRFKKGDLIYIPEGCRYSACFQDRSKDVETLLVNFSMKDINGNKICFNNEITCLMSDASSKYTDDIYKIILLSKSSKRSYLSIVASLYSLLENIAVHIEKSLVMESDKSLIIPALSYIDSHINECVTIPELAKMCLLSETCFRRYFKKYMGISPAKYKINLKILKAKQLLKLPETTISSVAFELGFYDISYFYKIFVKETGVTPQKYKDSFMQ